MVITLLTFFIFTFRNVESVPKVRNIPISLNNVRHSDPIPDSSLPKATPTQEIATTEPFSADVASAESETVESQDEKNGLYFLKVNLNFRVVRHI